MKKMHLLSKFHVSIIEATVKYEVFLQAFLQYRAALLVQIHTQHTTVSNAEMNKIN